MTKNLFVRKKNEGPQMGSSETKFFIATVASVSSSEGVTIIPDGQTSAVPKKYKIMSSVQTAPVVGDRVVVMKHSGTCIILGTIGVPDDIDSGEYVKKIGDTMTGTLNLDSTQFDADNPPAQSAADRRIDFRDKDGELIARLQDIFLSDGSTGFELIAARPVSGGSADNFLRMTVDANGNASVSVDNPQAWRTALGTDDVYVNQAGDAMTGNLDIDSMQYDTDVPPAQNSAGSFLRFRDKDGERVAALQPVFMADGDVGFELVAARLISGATNSNFIRLTVDASGTKKVYISSPKAWRGALELGSSGELPLTIAQGGSGNTETYFTETISDICSSSSDFTVTTAKYAKWGKIASIFIKGKWTRTTSSNGWITVLTMNSGKRPKFEAAARAWLNTNAYLYGNGILYFYGTITQDSEATFISTYLLA